MNRFTGWTTLVRLILRRDRVRLPVWVLSLTGLTGYSVIAVQGIYDTPQALAAYSATVGSSGATIAMTGPPTALDTIGGVTVFEVTPTALIGTALMAIFLVVRHTRTDEEAGRTELLRAGRLGRNADLLATSVVVGGAAVLVGAGVAASFVAAHLAVGSSLLYGASVACVGLVFTAIALAAAQVAEHGRSATGLALAVLGAAFLVRAVGDVQESALVWASPLGWTQQVRAFGDERWWPLLIAVTFMACLVAVAGWLTTRRDVGAGLVRPRPGRPVATRWLAGPTALAARLQRASLLGWGAGVATMGIAFGSLGEDVESMITDNEELAELFAQMSGGATIVDAYFAMTLMLTALLATGFTIAGVLRLRTEESDLRTEPLLATPLTRMQWALGWIAVTAAGTALVLTAAGLGAGLAYAAVAWDLGQVLPLLGAQLSYLPASLALGALAFALFGWLPRATGLTWLVLAVCVVIGWLGELFELPEWFRELSPFARTPQVLVEGLAAQPMLEVAAGVVVLTVAGAVGFRRRDLATG